MNILFLTVSTNGTSMIQFPVYSVEINHPVVSVDTLMPVVNKPYFFSVKHQQELTLLNLTQVSPYELWYFDAEQNFIRKDFSLHPGDAPFLIQTKARYIALVPQGMKADAELIQQQQKIRKFLLSVTTLPSQAPYNQEVTQWTLDLFTQTDEELIQTFNKQVNNPGWVTRRGYYLSCLREELHRRWPNHPALCSFDEKGNLIGLQLHTKVVLGEL